MPAEAAAAAARAHLLHAEFRHELPEVEHVPGAAADAAAAAAAVLWITFRMCLDGCRWYEPCRRVAAASTTSRAQPAATCPTLGLGHGLQLASLDAAYLGIKAEYAGRGARAEGGPGDELERAASGRCVEREHVPVPAVDPLERAASLRARGGRLVTAAIKRPRRGARAGTFCTCSLPSWGRKRNICGALGATPPRHGPPIHGRAGSTRF